MLRKFWRQQIPKLRALFGPDTSEKKRLQYLRVPREAKSSAAGSGCNKSASKPAPWRWKVGLMAGLNGKMINLDSRCTSCFSYCCDRILGKSDLKEEKAYCGLQSMIVVKAGLR